MAHFWFAFDIGAYEDSTAHLTMLQDGAYNRLIRHYYKTGKPIPESSEQIVRISGAHSTEEIEAVLYILKSFFCLRSDGYHNKRADKEIVKARQLSKLRATSAKRRWDDKRNAKPMQLHNSTDAKADTVTVTVTTTKEKSKAKAASAFILPDWIPQKDWQDFEEMRRKIRKPMTDRARSEIVTELFKLRNSGSDPVKVIAQSIANSWQFVFELKGQNGSNQRLTQQTAKPHHTAQHSRQNSNVLAVAAGLGIGSSSAQRSGSNGMGNQNHPDRTGHEARPESGGGAIVEGEIVGLPRQ